MLLPGKFEVSARRCLLLRAGGIDLALSLDVVDEVVAVPLLTPLPGAPAFVQGHFDLRGRTATALRLDRLLDLPDDRLGLYAPLIVLRGDDPALALRVDRVHRILPVTDAEVRPLAGEDTWNGCVTGEITTAGGIAYLLALDRLLLAQERLYLSRHQALTARRLEAIDDMSDAA